MKDILNKIFAFGNMSIYDWMYGKASFLWHGSFLQIISVLGVYRNGWAMKIILTTLPRDLSKKKIDFFPVKLPKTVRECKK